MVKVSVVTLSGAHGVGKSTLLSDLDEVTGRRFMLIPSVSTMYFKRLQEREARLGSPVPKTYADIDALGHRQAMQRELSEMLAELVEVAVRGSAGRTIVVDRWFGDIAAYSAIEIKCRPTLIDVLECQEVVFGGFMNNLKSIAEVDFLHIFIPASSCSHHLIRGESSEKAHRGTSPVEEWEAAYAEHNRYTQPENTLVISTADRFQRVAEVFQRRPDL